MDSEKNITPLNEILSEALAQQAAQEAQSAPQPEAPIDPNTNAPAPTTMEAGQATEPAQAANTGINPDTSAAAVTGLERAAQALAASQAQSQELAAALKEALAASSQQSEVARNAIDETIVSPDTGTVVSAPTNATPQNNIPNLNIDFNELAYLPDEERTQRISEFISGIKEITRAAVLEEVKPVISDYEQRQAAAVDEAVRTSIAGDPHFPDFNQKIEEINNVISNTPSLQNVEPESKYTLAYLITKGVDSLNAPAQQRTTDDIVNEVLANPEAMRIIEEKRAQSISDVNRNVPQFSASQSGTGNAPAIPDSKPKNLNDAYQAARKSLGL